MRVFQSLSESLSLFTDSSDLPETEEDSVQSLDAPLNGAEFLLRTEGETDLECKDIAILIVFAVILCGIVAVCYWGLANVLSIEVESGKAGSDPNSNQLIFGGEP